MKLVELIYWDIKKQQLREKCDLFDDFAIYIESLTYAKPAKKPCPPAQTMHFMNLPGQPKYADSDV